MFPMNRILSLGLMFSMAFSLTCATWPSLAKATLSVSPTSSSSVTAIASPQDVEFWVDPVNGDNSHSGASRGEALATLDEAWQRIPQGEQLTTPYTIWLTAGTYPEAAIPNYLEARYGTAQAPIFIRSSDGHGAAILAGDLNLFDVRYLYLIGLAVVPDPAGDAFHCERCDHIWLQNMVLDGGGQAQETIKANQSQYLYIEDSDISGAYDNAIDFVAVQYGHVTGNRIHNALDWCIYAKGGSAYLRIEGNEIYNCGTGGFTAGQGTGFEYITPPWLHYESYDIKFVNNLVHDTEGAGMGVNGGYNILLAYNTLYRVGARSHVLEVVFGARSCEGDATACADHQALGGWGPAVIGQSEPIPNRNVYVYNNVIYNPSGYQSQWQHLAVYGPQHPSAGSNVPDPAVTDANLVMRGNVIWNGPADHPLGIEDSGAGCQPSNPTCNAVQLLADNAINTLEPQLVNPGAGDFQPTTDSNLFSVSTFPIPAFTWEDAPSQPQVPAGELSNIISVDYAGNTRTGSAPPGAYTLSTTPPVMFVYLPVITRLGS